MSLSYHYMGTTSSGELLVKGIDGEREKWWKFDALCGVWFVGDSLDVMTCMAEGPNIPQEARSAVAAWMGQPAKREAETMDAVNVCETDEE